jgi:nucleotidyltransferase substrate binding protein (TIGR01987 family)
MSNSDAIRWLQRLEHFEAALAKLTDACKRDSYSELELAGVIQFFVFSQELAWNTLKDLLYVEGIDAKTPRAVWREAHNAGFVDDVDTALGTIAFRNELAHRYSEAMARRAVERIRADYLPLLTQILARLQQQRETERGA